MPGPDTAVVDANALVELLVRHPGVPDDLTGRTLSVGSDLSLYLADLVEHPENTSMTWDGVPLHETPEGRAARGMPLDLARRLIPGLAASLVARSATAFRRSVDRPLRAGKGGRGST